MKKNLFFGLTIIIVLVISVGAQGSTGSEGELKAKANELFEAQDYKEAKLMYAQLLSLYPKDPTYNYRFGACVLQTEADKTKPLKYLNFAASKANVDPLAYFYLGRAHHLNYEFALAVKQYSKFKNKASSDQRVKYDVDRQIEMCKNGNSLLAKLNEVQVLERQSIAEKDFYRIYDEDAIGGNIIVTPEQFKSKYDKKMDENSIIFLATDAKEVYYSSYGKKGDNGKDIYKAIKLGNGEWSEGVSLGNSINTKYDEDYAYIKPDGRTLYFASKGHTSMGGYDVFRSVLDEATGQWTEPENLDFAFNSADDDFMFVTDQAEITAYFASNRTNEFGEVTVYKVLTERAPAQLSVISGTFVAESNPDQKKAKITVIDKSTQETIGVYETDDNGNYSIEIGKNGGEYQFNIETNEVDPIHTGVVSIPKQDEFEVLGQELRLFGPGDAQQLLIKNIFDGTAANNLAATNGPSISSELIKLKANLEVNYNANDLAALQQKRVEQEKEINADNTPAGTQERDEPITNIEEIADTEDSNTAVASVDVAENQKEITEKETESSNNPTSSNQALTADQIEEEVRSISAEKNQAVDDKQKAIGIQYSTAVKLEQEATALFAKAGEMESSGSDKNEIDGIRKEAGVKAFRASVAAQLAQDLEASINDDLKSLEVIETTEMSINSAVEANELQNAANMLNELKSTNTETNTVEDVIKSSLSSIEERNSLADKKISDFSAKSKSFAEEKNSLQNQLATLSEEVAKASGKKKEELIKSEEATALDLKDIEYQFGILNQNLLEAKLTKKSLSTEKEEVLAASNRFKLGSSEVTQVTEEEKNQLFDQLKKIRDENRLAYAPGNELYQSADDVILAEEVSSINTVDSNAPNEIETIPSQNLQAEDSNEELDGENTNLFENQTVSSINSTYSGKINSAEAVEDEELRLANKIQVYENWLADLKGKKAEVSSAFDAEIKEEERSVLQTELSELTTNIRTQQQAKRDAELELAQLASGEFVADNSAIQNSNDITETSIVKDEFTSLDFNQKLQPTSAESATQLIEAKKSLFEAGELSSQQQVAQESAYSLPTAEERTAAFARANRLKKESEAKQIEAAEKFALFNLKEYQLNKAKIDKANELDERYTTESRDLALLLAEEANDFFTEAAILRSEIEEGDRLSQKEVNLQKAYDYEVLALQKQKEALEKLGMVLSEVLSAKTGDSAPKKVAKPFVQVIEDEEILAIVEAPKAKAQAELKSAEVVTLEDSIAKLQAVVDGMSDGAAKDSVQNRVKDLSAEREQKLQQAALYYERERQINEGLVGVVPSNANAENLVLAPSKPALEVILDTVDINGERKQLVLQASSFKEFANNRQSLVSQTKAAEVAYQEALALANENKRLQKQAIVESNMAKAVKNEDEKQRLIKSAEVIESKIKSNETKIEDLNKATKVKNILIQSLTEKDKAYLAQLNEAEKKEYIYLSNEFVPEIQEVAAIQTPAATTPSSEESGTIASEETAQDSRDLSPIEANNTLELPAGIEVDETADVTIDENSVEPTTVAQPAVKQVEETQAEPTAAIAKLNTPVVKRETSASIVKIENIDLVPREVKQAIFVTLNRNESAYNESKPIPTKANMPQGVVYKVQVGAFRKEIPASTFKGFAPLMAEPSGTGITRYTAGLFADENTALAARDEIRKIGYPDAFVVAFLNGERISVSKARTSGGAVTSPNSSTSFPKINGGNSGSSTSGTSVVASSAQVTQVPGGSKEALPAEFNSEQTEEVVNTETVEGVYYTIQIGVFSTPVKKGVFDYEGLNVVALPNGLYRYHAGMFNSLFDAADLKNEITATIKDAFITAYYNGKRISLSEASKLQNK